MNHFLMRETKKIKQYQRLGFIAKEARRIRELHEAGDISASTASKMLLELRQSPETVLNRLETKHEHSAA